VRIVDAHAHYGAPEGDVMGMLDELDIKVLNICVADADLNFPSGGTGRPGWRTQADHYCRLADAFPDRYAWCTTFDLPDFDNPRYADDVVARLERDFADGAIGCKIWKNIGMQVRSVEGEFVLLDDPILEPAIACIENSSKTLITHTGAGGCAWQPLDESNAHVDYYRNHPEWYMAGRSSYPSRTDLIGSRDRILERHPNLRVVGAHLACLEDELEMLADRLDRYPNFAVDTSARFPDLIRGDSAKICEFFTKYQDQVLFGLDITGQRLPTMAADERRRWLTSVRSQYQVQLDYIRTDRLINVDGVEVRGLNLSDDVVDKLLVTNAATWYPELAD
jgi:predicted TIM-barrel fold metal-dependent hydrolase